jgi:hypothetical protein
LIGEPINISFHNNVRRNDRFDQFWFNGKYIISTFGKDIEKYFKSHFPKLEITVSNSDTSSSIIITNYLNRERILKKAGI